MKRPAFQFYPADWRKDAALQSCSVAAQGLWINLLCISHECEPYGHMVVNGKPMTNAQISRLVGLSVKECDKLVGELEDAGVASRSADGALFSRRMVKDEGLRNVRAAGGEGGKNFGALGAEHGKTGGRPPKVRGVIKPPIEPPPSSSSSTSVIPSVAEATASGAGGPDPELTKSELWAAGKSILAGQGMPIAQCGSFVGKLVKDYGDGVVIDAVRAAVVQRPADVAQYLIASCQHAIGQRKPVNKQEALEARNRALAEEMIAEFNAKGAPIEAV